MAEKKSKKYTGPFVIVSVQPTEGGFYDARQRGKQDLHDFTKTPSFYFKLVCGHESEAGARRGYLRGFGPERWIPVPQEAHDRPCVTCTEALLAAGKPIPPCGLCKGHGEVEKTTQTFGPGGGSISWRRYRCPACKGKTAPPIEKDGASVR